MGLLLPEKAEEEEEEGWVGGRHFFQHVSVRSWTTAREGGGLASVSREERGGKERGYGGESRLLMASWVFWDSRNCCTSCRSEGESAARSMLVADGEEPREERGSIFDGGENGWEGVRSDGSEETDSGR